MVNRIIRTIHPVGCAAFITERFCELRHYPEYNWYYNVVYDCGRSKSMKNEQLFKMIDKALPSVHKHIDILFLSHFDYDHISGVDYLIKEGLLNETSTVFLPWIEVKYIDLYEDLLDICYSQIKRKMQDAGIPIEHVIAINRELDTEDDINDNLIYVESLKLHDITHPLDSSPFWRYIPFYVQDNSVYTDFLEHLRLNCKIEYDKLSDYQSLSQEEKKELKLLYRTFLGGETYDRKKAPTKINMNAMLLISRPFRDDTYQTASVHRASYNGVCDNAAMQSSCLYTSDVGLSEKKFLDYVVAAIDKHLCKDKRIGLMQIPHHGSYRCYNPDIYKELRFDALFVNGEIESTNPALSADVINDSWKHNVPLYIVDKEPMNRLCQVIYR